MKFLKLTPLVAIMAIAALPSAASAQRTKCEKPRLLASYSHSYHKVRRAHGTRAPGRNIRKWGVSKTRPSTCGQLRRSRATLRRMMHRGSTLLTATRPYVPPAQTRTLRATGAPLAAIRQCESGGRYSTNTGNGFYGAYQFTQSTWNSVGGSGNPAAASPAEQDRRAAMLYAREGPGPWPVCGR
jgi:hypothetical protein